MSAILIFVASVFAPAPIEDTIGVPLSRQCRITASFGDNVVRAVFFAYFRVGKIKTANQGTFSISDRDSNTPYIKRVRVVSSVTYYLRN